MGGLFSVVPPCMGACGCHAEGCLKPRMRWLIDIIVQSCFLRQSVRDLYHTTSSKDMQSVDKMYFMRMMKIRALRT